MEGKGNMLSRDGGVAKSGSIATAGHNLSLGLEEFLSTACLLMGLGTFLSLLNTFSSSLFACSPEEMASRGLKNMF